MGVTVSVDELTQLRAWKKSAMSSIKEWHQLEKLVPESFSADKLGWAWPHVVAAYIDHLKGVPQ